MTPAHPPLEARMLVPQRLDIEAAATTVASLGIPEVVRLVLRAAKGGTEEAFARSVQAYYARCALERGLGEITVPAELEARGADAWRAAAWEARRETTSKRLLEARSPALYQLLCEDATR